MLIKLSRQLKQMIRPGDTLICAVSGGADSVALLFGCHLLREQLGFRLEAAHFNHGLRGGESDGDEAFVRQLCHRFDIVLHCGAGAVKPGAKGLEAAAREARYGYFSTLQGWIATAHTADDNAETVLMHLVRGTGLKGLGAIAPVRGNVIRPMLQITRQEVLAFLREYHLSWRTDSTNEEDMFLRNRLRHHVIPLLQAENPRLAENLSAMALRLRRDEEALEAAADYAVLPDVSDLRQLPQAVRSRMLERFLKEQGVKEPEAEHIALAEKLVFSDRPSARGHFPGGVTVTRNYNRLETLRGQPLEEIALPPAGTVELHGLRITVAPAETIENTKHIFTLCPVGQVVLRARKSADEMRLSGGRKSLKKLFVDRKIPAHQRLQVPVLADEKGVLAVGGIGPNLDRVAQRVPAVRICIETTDQITMEESNG